MWRQPHAPPLCDTIVIVEADRVLFAKNSDRDPNESQLLDWMPRRTYAPGERLRCTWIEISQASATNAVLLSRPFWMWGAEMGANEHGVVIGNEAVFTRQPCARVGLTGMDLLRLALERGATAEQAVNVIIKMLIEFGQGGGCGHENRDFRYHNSFLIADPRGAYVLETAGKHHAVEAVQGARTISNGLTIPGFARQYSDTIKTSVSACRMRRERTQSMAAVASSPADLAAILRDHGEGCDAPRYSWMNGGMAAPCMHAGGVAAASQTTASWISELSSHSIRHWATATAAPCTGVFKPVCVDRPLELGPAPTDAFDGHTLWWRHELLHRRAVCNPQRIIPQFVAERNAMEREWFQSPPEGAAAWAMANEALTRWIRSAGSLPCRDTRPLFVRRYWRKRDRLAGIESALNTTIA